MGAHSLLSTALEGVMFARHHQTPTGGDRPQPNLWIEAPNQGGLRGQVELLGVGHEEGIPWPVLIADPIKDPP